MKKKDHVVTVSFTRPYYIWKWWKKKDVKTVVRIDSSGLDELILDDNFLKLLKEALK